jgi:hypothetical protein
MPDHSPLVLVEQGRLRPGMTAATDETVRGFRHKSRLW